MVEICPDCEEPRNIKKETKPHNCIETLKESLQQARQKNKGSRNQKKRPKNNSKQQR